MAQKCNCVVPGLCRINAIHRSMGLCCQHCIHISLAPRVAQVLAVGAECRKVRLVRVPGALGSGQVSQTFTSLPTRIASDASEMNPPP